MTFGIRLQGDLFVGQRSQFGHPVVYSPANIAMLFDSEQAAGTFIAGMAHYGHPLPDGYELATAYYLVGHATDAGRYLSRSSAPNQPPLWQGLAQAVTFQDEQNARTFVGQLLFRNDEERELLNRSRYIAAFASAEER